MRNITLLVVILVVLTSCGNITGGTPVKKFESDLQGTWESTDKSRYSGVLEIGFDRITITGYGESQTLSGANDNERPFKGFTKDIALKGYSEDGKIFIEAGETLREGIPYKYWEEKDHASYAITHKFLAFTFGGREEELKCR